MPITLCPPQGRHFLRGATYHSFTKAVSDVNSLYVEGYISYNRARNLKRSLLQFVALSHQASMANLFVV